MASEESVAHIFARLVELGYLAPELVPESEKVVENRLDTWDTYRPALQR